MAQLKNSVVQGSLRVTDTTITTDLMVTATKTARYAFIAPTSNGAPTWRALTKADISDFPTSMTPASHTHGNITNDGKIGSTANYAVYTTTGGTVTASSFTVNSPTASGTATSFIATVSQDSKGQITATKASLPTASTTTAGITTVGASGGAAAYSHGTHVSYGTSAAAVSTSASAGSAATVSRSDHVHNISLATGDSNGQVKIAGQNVAVKGLESGAFTTAYVHPTSAGNIHLPSGGTTGNFLKYGGSSGTGAWGNILTNDVKPIVAKTYANTNQYGTGNNDTSNSFYFMSVKPDGWYKPWQIKFRIRSFCPGYSNVDSITWCTLNGRANSTIYHNWNERYDPGHCYIASHILKSAGFNAGLGHAVGVNIRYGSGYTNSAYYRTFELELYEAVNCTVTTLDNATLWANWTNGTDTNYNGFSNYNAIDRGLMESGDIDTTGRDYSHSAYTTNNSTFRLPSYSLFGFDRTGKTQGISLYSSEYDGSTTSINTARVYNTNGIDWTRGLWYTNSGSNFAKSADVNISPAIFFYALDLRYSDNCVASSGASTLGLLPRKHVYLRGVIKSDGLFYLAPLSVTYNNATYQRAWTQDIPTSVQTDGTYQYVYWLVGDVYYNGSYANGGYQVNLITENKMYWYNNNRFEEYFGNTGVTSITLKAGAGITLDTDNTAITSTGTRTISVSGLNTSSGSESLWLNQKGGWTTPSAATIGAATSGHTHDISITQTGTATVTLAANTAYTLTAGGKTVVFKTPADSNTWNAMGGATSTANGTVGYINAAPPKDGYNTKYWRADGSWQVPYTHPTGDGNLHVPATGTDNNGKVLKAGSTAGSLSWGTLSASDVEAAPSSTISCTTANVKSALGTGSGTTKFLREDGSWQTPAYIANAAYGNISTSGTITSNGVALANGDYLLFSDASNNGKIERTSITIGTATNTWLRNDGTWATPTKADISLGNVENTKLSTWAGSTNITTLGTVTTGTWNGTAISGSYLGPMGGATSSAAGTKGAVPAPAAGDQAAFLQGDATWYKLNVRNGTGTGSIILGGVGEQGSNSLPTATADNAYAQGVWTTASGKHSHAEGYGTTASGNASHSEGSSTIASGWTSHAQGSGTIANHAYQHVFGEYNIGDTSTAAATERGNFIEIVGNGIASNSRSNARTLDWNGNEILSGNCTAVQFYETGSAAAPSGTITGSTAILTTSGWSNKSQTVTVQGVTASNTIVVSSAPTSMDAYSIAGIKCISQSTNSLTFTCNTVPTTNLTVNIIII